MAAVWCIHSGQRRWVDIKLSKTCTCWKPLLTHKIPFGYEKPRHTYCRTPLKENKFSRIQKPETTFFFFINCKLFNKYVSGKNGSSHDQCHKFAYIWKVTYKKNFPDFQCDLRLFWMMFLWTVVNDGTWSWERREVKLGLCLNAITLLNTRKSFWSNKVKRHAGGKDYPVCSRVEKHSSLMT